MAVQESREKGVTSELIPLDGTALPEPDFLHKPHRSWLGQHLAFVMLFALPVALAGLYLFALAADRYESEAQFVVRSPASTIMGEISGLLKGGSIARSADDAYIVHAYIRSREAVKVLIEECDLVAMIGRPNSDILWRYPLPFQQVSEVGIQKHLESLITIEYDSASGISTLRVQAFQPDDARRIAEVLLKHSEKLINTLSDRGINDAVALALERVELSRLRAVETQKRLTEFRTRHSLIDPSALSQGVQNTISQLALEKALAGASLKELSRFAAQSPQVRVLKNRIAALDSEIERERQSLAGRETTTLASIIADYETLVLERELAERTYAANVQALELARFDTRRQRLYLDQVSRATMPDRASYPYRILSFLVVLAISFAVYSVVSRVVADMKTHGGQ